ncbi:hypothetical protein DXT63_17050 [Thermoanaerobacteraceae bacterium SP2]|nr:hypothetical protein DXT63_17050 [Thermoanaerobacteraceae bacterium SP2]
MKASDEVAKMAMFINCLERGYTPNKAAKHIKHYHPIWGDPREGTNNNRPLPIELKLREIRWKEKFYANPEEFKYKLEHNSSYNAMIRNAIKKGEVIRALE